LIQLVLLYFLSNFIVAADVLISPAIFSYHFEDKEKLNNDNYGIGLQFDLKKNLSINLGQFKNSDYRNTNYLTSSYYFHTISDFKLGVLIGGFDGYPNENSGNFFLAALPVINYKKKYFQLNLSYVPKISNHLKSAAMVQILFPIYSSTR
tara:strand:- start:104 stop:553 length:450 start_codon:yes stop_codon:yes gene_type:complete